MDVGFVLESMYYTLKPLLLDIESLPEVKQNSNNNSMMTLHATQNQFGDVCIRQNLDWWMIYLG